MLYSLIDKNLIRRDLSKPRNIDEELYDKLIIAIDEYEPEHNVPKSATILMNISSEINVNIHTMYYTRVISTDKLVSIVDFHHDRTSELYTQSDIKIIFRELAFRSTNEVHNLGFKYEESYKAYLCECVNLALEMRNDDFLDLCIEKLKETSHNLDETYESAVIYPSKKYVEFLSKYDNDQQRSYDAIHSIMHDLEPDGYEILEYIVEYFRHEEILYNILIFFNNILKFIMRYIDHDLIIEYVSKLRPNLLDDVLNFYSENV